jgi:hypothetical protein
MQSFKAFLEVYSKALSIALKLSKEFAVYSVSYDK